MKITQQTATELVIHSPRRPKELVLPLIILGITLLGLGLATSGGATTAAILALVALGAYGLNMLYGALQSETLTVDKAASEVRCRRTTLLGPQNWHIPLADLQNIRVGSLKRRYKKANGNRATRWTYTLTFVTTADESKTLLSQDDGDSVDAAYHAINQFIGPFVPDPNPPNETNPRMRITPDYQRWREAIFNLTPAQAGAADCDTHQVYGVLMDVGMMEDATSEQWALSVTAFFSGDASFQPTLGGGTLGLGHDPKVANVAQEIVAIAQTLLPKAFPINDRALPEPDLVQFFFFTPDGVYGVADHIQKLQASGDSLGQMFNRFGVIRQFADGSR